MPKLGVRILSWTHTSTGTHLSTCHTLSQSKKGSNSNSARLATCDADAIALLVEAPTRHPSASVTEALFSISFSLQLVPIFVKIFEVVERWVPVEVWVHDSMRAEGPVWRSHVSLPRVCGCNWYPRPTLFLPFIPHTIFSMAQLPHETASIPQGTSHRGVLPIPQPCHRQFPQRLHQVAPPTRYRMRNSPDFR